MIKKGIILAGGFGTRMGPLTKVVNKQLLPIHDKPMIFYPLSILMLAGIRKILIIVNKGQSRNFRKIFTNENELGLEITFAEQNYPGGLPEAFIIGKKFIGKDKVALILGDNFFYGQNLTNKLIQNTKMKSGAKVFLHPVKSPSSYGVATIKKNKIIKIVEKPKITKSNLAITGLYFFDNKVVSLTQKLKPSKRKELEIVDLLKKYKNKKQLKIDFLGRGGVWLDAGTIRDYYDTSAFVSAVENRQGLKIACLEEIALNKKWITKKNIKKSIIPIIQRSLLKIVKLMLFLYQYQII